jgi:NO-binding membrane sensor protein with MHYT domain
MHIVDQTKLVIGVVFALVAIAIFVTSRRSRGFGQRKQAAALLLIGGVLLIATGLGYIDIKGMLSG